MAQVYLKKGAQARFLKRVKEALDDLSWKQVSEICEVSVWTMRAWRKEEWRMSYRALVRLSRMTKVPTPEILEIVSEEERRRRSGIAGGHATFTRHGSPGTLEGRSRNPCVLLLAYFSPSLFSVVHCIFILFI